MQSPCKKLLHVVHRSFLSIVALTFPATGQETEYQKCLMQALSTLQKLHYDKFRIINVSERRYDILQMNNPGQVSQSLCHL